MKADHYLALKHLLSAYFHEDWQLDDPTYRDVLKRYVELEPRERVVDVVAEIGSLLSIAPHRDDLRALLLDELGSSYDPEVDHIAVAQWLGNVRDYLVHDNFEID